MDRHMDWHLQLSWIIIHLLFILDFCFWHLIFFFFDHSVYFCLLILLAQTHYNSVFLDYFLFSDRYELSAGIYWSKVCQWTICLSLFWFSSTSKCPLCIRWFMNPPCNEYYVASILRSSNLCRNRYFDVYEPISSSYWCESFICWRYRIGCFLMGLLGQSSFAWHWFFLEQPPFR